MRRGHGFTLIEVLVVVAIMGLLVAILVPSLASARRQARLVSCATQLSQIGKAFTAYLPENRDRMPAISHMPSNDSSPVDKTVWLPDVLSRHLGGARTGAKQGSAADPVTTPGLVKNNAVFQCQNDKPNFTKRTGADQAGKSFFQSERSSYEYRTRLNGCLPSEFGEAVIRHFHGETNQSKNIPPNTVWVMRDWDNFHSTKFIPVPDPSDPDHDTFRPAGGPGARRYLFIDGHVTDWELR